MELRPREEIILQKGVQMEASLPIHPPAQDFPEWTTRFVCISAKKVCACVYTVKKNVSYITETLAGMSVASWDV